MPSCWQLRPSVKVRFTVFVRFGDKFEGFLLHRVMERLFKSLNLPVEPFFQVFRWIQQVLALGIDVPVAFYTLEVKII